MTAHVYVPLEVLTAANLNASMAFKADLDPVTGKVLASELPDLAAIAAAAVPPLLAPVSASAAAALAAALAAAAAAAAAQATASAAIPAGQEGAPGGVATLGPDGLLLKAQRPPASGSAGPVYTPPLAADFPTWLAKGSSSATDTAPGLQFAPELIGASAGNILKGLFKPLPTGDFDIEAIVEKQGVNWPFIAVGVSLLESSSGRYHSLHLGAVYFSDPWNSAATDAGGLSQLFWSNATTISDGVGLPLPVMKLHQRITRVGGTVTRFFRHTPDSLWVPLWGMTVPTPFVPDQVGLTWMASANGSFTNYPPQPFLVRHFGAVT